MVIQRKQKVIDTGSRLTLNKWLNGRSSYSEVEYLNKNVPALQKQVIKARPHENQNKILQLTVAVLLLLPVFAMPELYFFSKNRPLKLFDRLLTFCLHN